MKRCVRITTFARQLRDKGLLDHILFSRRSMTRLVEDVSATSGYLSTVSCTYPSEQRGRASCAGTSLKTSLPYHDLALFPEGIVCHKGGSLPEDETKAPFSMGLLSTTLLPDRPVGGRASVTETSS
jgi:hypothetical protein